MTGGGAIIKDGCSAGGSLTAYYGNLMSKLCK